MGFCIDTNIFIYSVDKNSPWHARSTDFLKQKLYSQETIYIPWAIVYSFVRISTHSSIFSNPLTPAEAIENMELVINSPNVEMLSDTKASWNIFNHMQNELPLRGNSIPDAQIAAVLEANGIRTLYTSDSDFWKFPNLDPVNPFR